MQIIMQRDIKLSSDFPNNSSICRLVSPQERKNEWCQKWKMKRVSIYTGLKN